MQACDPLPGAAIVILLLWLWLARRDWRPAAALVMVATAIVPWVRDDLDGRTMFLFYALPAVPAGTYEAGLAAHVASATTRTQAASCGRT